MHHLPEDDELTPAPKGPHVKAQLAYYEKRRRYEIAKRTATEAKYAMDEAKKELVEVMMDLGMRRLEYMTDGSTIHFKGGFNVSVTKENEVEVREFLRRQYGDDSEFEESKLSKKAVRDRLQEDISNRRLSETEVPDCLKLSQYPDLQVRGWIEP